MAEWRLLGYIIVICQRLQHVTMQRDILKQRENGRKEILMCILGDEEKVGKGVIYILL